MFFIISSVKIVIKIKSEMNNSCFFNYQKYDFPLCFPRVFSDSSLATNRLLFDCYSITIRVKWYNNAFIKVDKIDNV